MDCIGFPIKICGEELFSLFSELSGNPLSNPELLHILHQVERV